MYFSYFILEVYGTSAGPTHILLPSSLTMWTISAASSTTTLAGIWMPMNHQNLLTTKILFLICKKSTLHLLLFQGWSQGIDCVNIEVDTMRVVINHLGCIMYGTIA